MRPNPMKALAMYMEGAMPFDEFIAIMAEYEKVMRETEQVMIEWQCEIDHDLDPRRGN
jgi:hypothetical protein